MYSPEQIKKNLASRAASCEFGDDVGAGFLVRENKSFRFIYSFGEGWEHVSVSCQDRCPTWEEMCFFKDIFWPGNETCVQYHPAQSDYVNMHKYCLHIWRPIDGKFPTPPKIMVGF